LDESGGLVEVYVEQSFPGITPKEAKSAWLSYQWEKGGGLLGAAVLLSDTNSKRRLLPIFMEEALKNHETEEENGMDSKKQEDEELDVQYSVTDMGLFSSELKDGTHVAKVIFSLEDSTDGEDFSTKMIWNVSFEAIHRREFWKSFTENNIQTVTLNLASYLATPTLYKRITYLDWDKSSLSKKDITDEWINFVWKDGGGLPIPNFMLWYLGDGKRIYVPPFLTESIQSVTSLDANDNINTSGEILYRVDNPNFLFAHTHAGRVIFQKETNQRVKMIWEVEVRPFRGFGPFVDILLSSIISNLARNFKNHVIEPDAMVAISPPRGGDGETDVAQISKNSWIGGVLAAHLSDQRSTIEQTVSLLQPWTWGRASGYDEPEEGEKFSNEYLS